MKTVVKLAKSQAAINFIVKLIRAIKAAELKYKEPKLINAWNGAKNAGCIPALNCSPHSLRDKWGFV